MIRSKKAETYRLKALLKIESQVRASGFERIAGVDEAGRGPLAGPIVAAACILPEGFVLPGIDDSKKLDLDLRDKLYEELILHPDVIQAVFALEAVDIDAHNIHYATLMAMKGAVDRLTSKPDFLLVDGKFLPDGDIPGEAVIKGDSHVQCIAAASILAKVTRDQIMRGYDLLYPHYGFASHKGYGTKKHLEAIKQHGPSPIHRMSFNLR